MWQPPLLLVLLCTGLSLRRLGMLGILEVVAEAVEVEAEAEVAVKEAVEAVVPEEVGGGVQEVAAEAAQ